MWVYVGGRTQCLYLFGCGLWIDVLLGIGEVPISKKTEIPLRVVFQIGKNPM